MTSKEKVIVITGASSGLGEATARLLCAQGASVVLGANAPDYFFFPAAARLAAGSVHVQLWISQPVGPFFRTNVICAVSRMPTPRSLKL